MNKEIEQIKKRNSIVEADKAWETSYSRRIIIALMTYLVIGLFLTFINISKPWYNAIVPTTGFFLSTLTLSLFKKMWLFYFYKK